MTSTITKHRAPDVVLLCEEEGFYCPDFVDVTKRVFNRRWFAEKVHSLRMILLQESPAAFRVRNLFVSANALHRA